MKVLPLRLSISHSFTLLEVMVSSTILVGAILGISMTFLSIANLNTISKENSLAVNKARKIMEEVRSTPFRKIFSKYEDKNYPVQGFNLQEGDLDGCVGKIKVIKVNDNKDLLEVTVRLDWRGKFGNRSLTIKTRIVSVKKKLRTIVDDLIGWVF